MSDVSITDLIRRRAVDAVYEIGEVGSNLIPEFQADLIHETVDAVLKVALESVTVPTEKELDNAAFDYVDDQPTTYTERGDFYERSQMRAAFIAGFRLSAPVDPEWETSTEYAYGRLGTDVIVSTGEDVDDLGSAQYNAKEYWLDVLSRQVKRAPWGKFNERNAKQ